VDLDDPRVAAVLADVARHRSAYMWPWESEPHSVAGGILDDETYDWLAVVRGMLATGGSPVVVDEATLIAANDIARETTGIDVDHTGSSGLAGLLDLRRRGVVGPDESVAVLFTGARRGPSAPPTGARTGDRS
jgi:threonine synthase